jgi:hypothetical protein
LVDVTSQLPSYQENIKNKIASLRSPTGQILNKATDAVVELSKELAAAPASDLTAGKHGTPKSPSAVRPLSVQVVSPPTNWLDYAGSVLGPLGTAGIAIVFTIFMLMRREDLRNRLIRKRHWLGVVCKRIVKASRCGQISCGERSTIQRRFSCANWPAEVGRKNRRRKWWATIGAVCD